MWKYKDLDQYADAKANLKTGVYSSENCLSLHHGEGASLGLSQYKVQLLNYKKDEVDGSCCSVGYTFEP